MLVKLLLDRAECTPISSPRQREILGARTQGGEHEPSCWSGPILSAITLSCNIHAGRIGAISDQFALGTPWDEVRRTASQLAIQFRHAHGVKQPATLHEDELEYQEGWKERRARLERQFEVKPALTFGNGNGHGTPAPSPARAGRPEAID